MWTLSTRTIEGYNRDSEGMGGQYRGKEESPVESREFRSKLLAESPRGHTCFLVILRNLRSTSWSCGKCTQEAYQRQQDFQAK